MTEYTVDRSFMTSVERTPRVLEIAEAFGLGLSDKKFVVYDNLKIDIRPSDVVYITGQSGSGKSLLLRDLSEKMQVSGLKVANLDDIKLPDMPVIDCLGKDTLDATNLLAKAGISDAYIYTRKPTELSDGQRYRLRLAKVMERDDADVWLADEFGAVLDRVTAKAVAFNIAKVARATGKILMVATTHTDLLQELAPNLTIMKRFREKVEINTSHV